MCVTIRKLSDTRKNPLKRPEYTAMVSIQTKALNTLGYLVFRLYQ